MSFDRSAPASRKRVVERILELASTVRDGRYSFVGRGPVNWFAFPFDNHRFAFALVVDDSKLFRPSGAGVADCTMSFEMFTKLAFQDNYREVKSLDENVMETMYSDANWILDKLINDSRNEMNEPLVLRFDESSHAVREVFDAALDVQGLIAQVQFDY
jgi:hypothetical protein